MVAIVTRSTLFIATAIVARFTITMTVITSSTRIRSKKSIRTRIYHPTIALSKPIPGAQKQLRTSISTGNTILSSSITSSTIPMTSLTQIPIHIIPIRTTPRPSTITRPILKPIPTTLQQLHPGSLTTQTIILRDTITTPTIRMTSITHTTSSTHHIARRTASTIITTTIIIPRPASIKQQMITRTSHTLIPLRTRQTLR
mmetsp:Transcript_24937/g.28491  ORF Transcript_24937/g.28491 Transcript_24937/m.28491 type:complete len:200 (+) Transcript_24937:247-846(+)